MIAKKNVYYYIREAQAESEKKFKRTYEHAPIFNPVIMLSDIEKILAEESLIDITGEDEINVGLLAAKALSSDSRFSKYSNLLHQVWHSFLAVQKQPFDPSQLSGPEKIAYDFYVHHGFSGHQIPGHFAGIDFSNL